MRATELIERLRAMVAVHGDRPVYVHDPMSGHYPFMGPNVVRADDAGALILDLELCGEDDEAD